MDSFVIEGGHLLKGEITPQGAKNEALQVISATLLTGDEVEISNIPDILDVNNLIQLLRDINVKVTPRGKGCYAFKADEVNLEYLGSDEFVRKCAALRGSVLTIGPLLTRFGRAIVAEPGGDKIGRRRLDTHFLGFKYLGAKFDFIEERNVYEIHCDRLKGRAIELFKTRQALIRVLRRINTEREALERGQAEHGKESDGRTDNSRPAE